MIIETKFNKNDKMYVINKGRTREGKTLWFATGPFIIDKVVFDLENGVQYGTNYSMHLDKEQDCFRTEQEVIEEGQRRDWEEEFKKMCEENIEKTVEKIKKEINK